MREIHGFSDAKAECLDENFMVPSEVVRAVTDELKAALGEAPDLLALERFCLEERTKSFGSTSIRIDLITAVHAM
jgi:hypothetical protein